MHWYGDFVLTEKELLKSLSTRINDSSNRRRFPPYLQSSVTTFTTISKRIQVRSSFEIENSVSIHTAKEVKIQHALDWELLVVVEQGLSRPGKELTGGHGLRLKVTSDF